jgi:hypothetical protein
LHADRFRSNICAGWYKNASVPPLLSLFYTHKGAGAFFKDKNNINGIMQDASCRTMIQGLKGKQHFAPVSLVASILFLKYLSEKTVSILLTKIIWYN